MTNSMESYKDGAGEWRWRIKIDGNIVADSGEGYKQERNALHSLFGIFFGSYDTSWLDLYTKWQNYSGEQVPEPNVRMVSPQFGGGGELKDEGFATTADAPEVLIRPQAGVEDNPGNQE